MSHEPIQAARPPTADTAVGWSWMGSNEPLFRRVAGQIERYIVGNGLSPGERLPGERELCELLGVSRASVREALCSLQTRGIVGVRHGKGVFVAAPDEGERAVQLFNRLHDVGLEELFAMREVLEVPAAGWAASAATDAQLQALVVTFEGLERAVHDRRPAKELQIIDARLHLQITEYANNRFLTMTQEILQEILARSMDTTLSIAGRSARSVREHADIVQALLARDPRRARAAVRRHIHSAHRAAARRIADEHSRAADAPRADAPSAPSSGGYLLPPDAQVASSGPTPPATIRSHRRNPHTRIHWAGSYSTRYMATPTAVLHSNAASSRGLRGTQSIFAPDSRRIPSLLTRLALACP